MENKQREYLFDNYKVLLIVLVVIGHFIEPCYDQNPFLYELKWGIMGRSMNLPGRSGRKISETAYKIANKFVGFN